MANKEKLKEIKEKLEIKFSNFVVVTAILKGTPCMSTDEMECAPDKIGVVLHPKERMDSGDIDEFTGRDISVGVVKLFGNTIEELERKVNFYIRLFDDKTEE